MLATFSIGIAERQSYRTFPRKIRERSASRFRRLRTRLRPSYPIARRGPAPSRTSHLGASLSGQQTNQPRHDDTALPRSRRAGWLGGAIGVWRRFPDSNHKDQKYGDLWHLILHLELNRFKNSAYLLMILVGRE